MQVLVTYVRDRVTPESHTTKYDDISHHARRKVSNNDEAHSEIDGVVGVHGPCGPCGPCFEI